MFSKKFLADMTERALKTAAQAAFALMGTDAIGWTSLDWKEIGVGVLGATVLSILSSIISAGRGDPGSASFLKVTNKS